jgi:hypothetical protein
MMHSIWAWILQQLSKMNISSTEEIWNIPCLPSLDFIAKEVMKIYRRNYGQNTII